MTATARGYSWAPFERSNTAAVKHGADSERFISPRAEALRAWLVEVAPWCALPTMRAEVEAWAWAEARLSLYREWIDTRGELDADGNAPVAVDRLDRLEETAARRRAALGLSPISWAKLTAQLGAADGEAAARSLTALKEIGRDLATATRELPSESEQP
jgi:hypothetical protein